MGQFFQTRSAVFPSHHTDLSTPNGNCTDGMLRLVGGANSLEGRVEICINNAWGTVCDNSFGTREAQVICAQLEFSRTSKLC